MLRVSDLFAIVAEERDFILPLDCLEPGLDGLVVGDTFRIAAFRNSVNLLRHDKLPLFDHLEVTDYVHCGFRSYEGELVEFLVFEEFILDFDDSLLAEIFAAEVDSYSNLILDALEVENVEGLIYIFSWYVVQYGTILQCADY